MEISYLKEVTSTQTFLIDAIKKKELTPAVCVYATKQTQGIGSRGNSWIGKEGNLFVSFALALEDLPKDLKIESASIYFASIVLEVLKTYDSKVWLKWPNDFYLQDKKVGGMISTLVRNNIVCGFGLNLVDAPEGFGVLDVDLTPKEIVEGFVKKLEKFPSWKQVFRKYSVEFYKNKSFFTHNENEKRVSLADAVLQEDGSIMVNNERIYSLR